MGRFGGERVEEMVENMGHIGDVARSKKEEIRVNNMRPCDSSNGGGRDRSWGRIKNNEKEK